MAKGEVNGPGYGQGPIVREIYRFTQKLRLDRFLPCMAWHGMAFGGSGE